MVLLADGGDEGMTEKGFIGNLDFLSNFYPTRIEHGGLIWPTSEHLYQALKTSDTTAREIIRIASTPGQAKRLGRRVPIRAGWGDRRMAVMRYVVHLKFGSHQFLSERLIATGSQKLIEVNYWGDTFWGVYNGEGDNFLGRILMDEREAQRALVSA